MRILSDMLVVKAPLRWPVCLGAWWRCLGACLMCIAHARRLGASCSLLACICRCLVLLLPLLACLPDETECAVKTCCDECLVRLAGACNVHDQRFMLARSKLDALKEASSCHDMWEVIQQVHRGRVKQGRRVGEGRRRVGGARKRVPGVLFFVLVVCDGADLSS